MVEGRGVEKYFSLLPQHRSTSTVKVRAKLDLFFLGKTESVI